MKCEQVKERLDDYVDGELSEQEFQEVELHLAGCPSCRDEERGLRAVLAMAAALPREQQPARDLWPDIAGRIRQRRLHLVPSILHRPAAWWGAGLAAAAAAVVVAWLAPHGTGRGTEVARGGPAGGGRPVAVRMSPDALHEAERDYERAASELLAALGARRASLSPDTAAALDENLRVIDEALAQIRAALERDPESPRLNRMLASTHEKKIETLRRVLKLTT